MTSSDFASGFRAGVEAAARMAESCAPSPEPNTVDTRVIHQMRMAADIARYIRALQPPQQPDAAPRCQCTFEQGDSECAVHPTCPGCGANWKKNDVCTCGEVFARALKQQPDAAVCVDCGHSSARHLGDERGYFPCNAVGCTCKHVSPSSQQPDAAPSDWIEIPAEQDVRYALWVGHGHGIARLYGDDGEMQCNACPPPAQDYKRAPLSMLVRTALTALRAAPASPAVTAWHALSESCRQAPILVLERTLRNTSADRQLPLGLEDAMVKAIDLLRSLAPEAGDDR